MPMADPTESPTAPTLADLTEWTQALGAAQQQMIEQGLGAWQHFQPFDPKQVEAVQGLWAEGMAFWQRLLDPQALAAAEKPAHAKDKRFRSDAWRKNPMFDWMRRSYLAVADHMLEQVGRIDGLDDAQRRQLKFATQGFVDAMSPSNFAFTNPEVMERAIATKGESLRVGLQHMLDDLQKGQLTHTDPTAFEVGRNLATTPGKVVKRTPLYELIQYSPTTEDVLATPVVVFPPWINRFYILDLTPEKSFIRWAVGEGLTVFMVSWKSADKAMAGIRWDDYVAAQIDAVDTVRALLGVPAVHAIGYCVAGTTLAATLSVLAARGEADKVRSATFFTAQVDFRQAGDLQHFVTDEQLAAIRALSPDGFLDGRYMAATFNLLRGRDLVWNYVTNNYLLGQDYAPFDLLHWNGDTTNLPTGWHLDYLADLYRDNKLVTPGAMEVAGIPLDLTRVATPSYVQAGREDHIAPADSVWEVTRHFTGPIRFVLAGSGHIAGVVNPPDAGKYQYWTNDQPAESLADFVAGATETRGSWWPDWKVWLISHGSETVAAKGARRPGEGSMPALTDAPGEYVRQR